MAKETVPNRQYTDEFKLEALRLAESVGINQAAKRLGMPSSSLGNWARLKRSGKLGDLPRAGPIKGSPSIVRQHPKAPPIHEAIDHEVHAPTFARTLRRGGDYPQVACKLAPSLRPHAQAKALLSVEAPQALTADPQALALQHDQDPAVAEPRSRLGNGADLLPQCHVVTPHRFVSAGRATQP